MTEINHTCQIIGNDFSIVLSEEVLRSSNTVGQMDPITHIIRIGTCLDQDGRYSTLLHEIIEAIDNDAELGLEHPTMTLMANALMGALKSLGVFITMDGLPLEITTKNSGLSKE